MKKDSADSDPYLVHLNYQMATTKTKLSSADIYFSGKQEKCTVRK